MYLGVAQIGSFEFECRRWRMKRKRKGVAVEILCRSKTLKISGTARVSGARGFKLRLVLLFKYFLVLYLGVAQIGSALPWGGRGRGFKSRHSDQKSNSTFGLGCFFLFVLRGTRTLRGLRV